ncbi:MAG TPA: glycosyltransferase family A protein [Candidatus Acidoferrales bacterium]|nr:glycosyltransferase family A protein [Candidatus Acidoferrales bacterium]
MSTMKIAVCIPTYCRPAFLREAIDSCLRQTRPPDEIVIEDNSPDEATEDMVRGLQRQSPVPLSYAHVRERRSQAENFNAMIQRISSSHFVLLHDDDILLSNALADLSACWERYPDLTAAYGKQHIMSDAGIVDLGESERLNADYFRTADREGLQEWSSFPGLTQQFPNDGFLLQTAAARAILWRPAVRNACEFDFQLRLCFQFRGFCFVNAYTMHCRRTNVGMSQSKLDDAALISFRLLHETLLPEEAEKLRRMKLQELAPPAAMQALQAGDRAEAMRIYWGEFYPWRRRLSALGIWQLGRLILPEALVGLLRRQARVRET